MDIKHEKIIFGIQFRISKRIVLILDVDTFHMPSMIEMRKQNKM